GTYFSTSDFAADGCDRLAFNSNQPDSVNFQTGTFVNRTTDRQPEDSGQFGLALRKYVSSVDTEFGAYAMNYHSRIPLVGLKKPSAGNATFGPNTDAAYFIDYPEDQTVFGLSFATNVGGWAWSGEVSRINDRPLQINATDLLRSGLAGGDPTANPLGSGPIAATAPADLNNRIAGAAAGSRVAGFTPFDVTQVQTTFIKTFDRVLGSNNIVLVAEVAAVMVDDLPDPSDQTNIRYGRSAVFGSGFNQSKAGFTTDFSWGYRLRSRATYRNVFGNVDLIPSLAWSDDVDGWSPEPAQAFNEGRQSLGLGMTFEFDANTTASVNYTTFTNAADFDVLRDRDFLSLSASYSF
ncbi:MAG: DUF1302 family protein, partial [Limnobacter sp.]|nr:DUF1302 family protein [Limnobacter sp.]